MASPSSVISAHRQRLNQYDDVFVPAATSAPHYATYAIRPEQGTGRSDLYDFDRLRLGRGQFCFHAPRALPCEMPFASLGVTLVVAGTLHFTHRQSGKTWPVTSPLLVLRKGQFGPVDVQLPAHTPVALLSLDFSQELLESLQAAGQDNTITRFFQGTGDDRFQFLERPDARLLGLAHYLMQLPQATGEVERLHLEGQALSLLALLFSQPPQPSIRHAREIQHAITFLRAHCHQRITTRALAREVGLNECDLKRHFKQATGQSIHAFHEHRRMQLAALLLSQGKSMHAVAQAVGYTNLNYFKVRWEKYFPADTRGTAGIGR